MNLIIIKFRIILNNFVGYFVGNYCNSGPYGFMQGYVKFSGLMDGGGVNASLSLCVKAGRRGAGATGNGGR